MTLRYALEIFNNIDRPDENKLDKVLKGLAIHRVLNMPTHNSVTKDAMLKVIDWLWHQAFGFDEKKEE